MKFIETDHDRGLRSHLTRAPIRFTHLQFLDAIANGDELAGSPEETVHLDALHVLQHLVHVSLIIPGLQKHIQNEEGLDSDSL